MIGESEYSLRNFPITWPDQVWASDITYSPWQRGFLYLTAVMDLDSRNVVSWVALQHADRRLVLGRSRGSDHRRTPGDLQPGPETQFAELAFTSRLEKGGAVISMDCRGRAFDNVFVELLWRTGKYEEVYLPDYTDDSKAEGSLEDYVLRVAAPSPVLPDTGGGVSGWVNRERALAIKSPSRRTQNKRTLPANITMNIGITHEQPHGRANPR